MPSRPESMCLLQSTQPPHGATMPVIHQQGLKTQTPQRGRFQVSLRKLATKIVQKSRVESQRARVFILLTTLRKAALISS